MKIPCQAGKTYSPDAKQVAEWQAAYPTLDIKDEIKRAVVWLAERPLRTARGVRQGLVFWFNRSLKDQLNDAGGTDESRRRQAKRRELGWDLDEPGIAEDERRIRARTIQLRTERHFLSHPGARRPAIRELRDEHAIAPHGACRRESRGDIPF